jgi:hypothetical protein
VLRRIHPTSQRQESDVFPTFYRINTLRELQRHFPTAHFEHFSYLFNGEPTYHANSFLLALMMDAAGRLMPEYFAKSLHVFMRKRSRHRGTFGQPDAV